MNRERIWYLTSKKIASEATAEELSELEELLRKDPDMHYSLQNINDIWELPVRLSADTDEAFHRHVDRMKATGADWDEKMQKEEDYILPVGSISSPIWKWVSITAIFILATGIFIYLYSDASSNKTAAQQAGVQPPEKNEISTRYGSKTKIKLPDGSQVWLNAGSNLNYSKNFGNKIREVELTGEAYFDVVKNPAIPFIIHTSGMDVKVLGTQFNIKSYPGEKTTEASLIRGSIEVSIKNRPAEKIILKPNEKIVVANQLDFKTSTVRADAKRNSDPIVAIKNLTYERRDGTIIETSWVENKLIFQDESFKDLALKMERWYGVSINFTDESVEQLRFTGIFQNESIRQALYALKITAAFDYTVQDNKVTISK